MAHPGALQERSVAIVARVAWSGQGSWDPMASWTGRNAGANRPNRGIGRNVVPEQLDTSRCRQLSRSKCRSEAAG